MTLEELKAYFPKDVYKIFPVNVDTLITGAMDKPSCDEAMWFLIGCIYDYVKNQYTNENDLQCLIKEYNNWVKTTFKNYYLEHNKVRPFETACALAAQKWLDIMFLNKKQQSKGLGIVTIDMSKLTKEVKDKLITLIADYYLHCNFASPFLSIKNYKPDPHLKSILTECGFSETEIWHFAPNSLDISIRPHDNKIRILTSSKRIFK